ncbi:hypothetical protein E7V67_011885 [[Empedobacter] haloabium]|uniref:Uncharacterized protein n=1 Tax=[Empedobacter] haloabium TaxID=592317 RepID=A0ABZ1USP8_9BURK
MMRALFAIGLAASMAAPAAAQMSFTTMGRLFTTPADRILLDQQRASAAPPGTATAAGPAGTTATPAPAGAMPGMAAPVTTPPAPAPAPVRFGGVLRRSDGQATIWVDDAVQEAVVHGRPAAGVPVDVGGRRVLLKPGQSWDPASGAIVDVQRGAGAR